MTVKEWLKSWNGFTRRKLTDFASQVEEDLSDLITVFPRYIRWGIHHFLPENCLANSVGPGGGIEWGDEYLNMYSSPVEDSFVEVWKSLGDEHFPPPSWDRKRYLGCSIVVTPTSTQRSFTGMGEFGSDSCVGILWEGYKIYAYSGDGSNTLRTEIGEFTNQTRFLVEVKFSPGEKAEFFLNGEKKGEHASTLPSGSDGATTLFDIFSEGRGGNSQIYVYGIEFVQF